MASRLIVEMDDPGALKGVQGVRRERQCRRRGPVRADRDHRLFAGTQEVRLRLRGLVTRTSGPVAVTLAEGASCRLIGSCSKLWGSIRLKLA